MGVASGKISYEQDNTFAANQGRNIGTFQSRAPVQNEKVFPYQFTTPGNNDIGMTDIIGNPQHPTANNSFRFTGKPLSLLSRLTALRDDEVQRITDAHLNVTGKQIQGLNNGAYMATVLGASLIIIPLCFMCCDWWKRCTLPAFDVPISVYQGLSKLLKGSSLRSLDISVKDNSFDALKASVLLEGLTYSRIGYFSFRNEAGEYDYVSNQFSDFDRHMRPVKQLTHISSDLRWGSIVVL